MRHLTYAILMAKIENWPKIRGNIIIQKYKKEDVNASLVHELRFLDERKLSILRQLGRVYEIYLPDRHPLFEKGILRQGRLSELSDVTNMGGFLQEDRSIHFIEHVDEISDLKNFVSDSTLDLLRYDGEKYRRVTSILYDGKEIIKVSGVRECNLI